jgi:hypothetical protein
MACLETLARDWSVGGQGDDAEVSR